MMIFAIIEMIQRREIIVQVFWIRNNRDFFFIFSFAAPYREILHSGSAKGWNENVAAIPEAGLPSFSMSAGPNDKSRSRNPEVSKDDLCIVISRYGPS